MERDEQIAIILRAVIELEEMGDHVAMQLAEADLKQLSREK